MATGMPRRNGVIGFAMAPAVVQAVKAAPQASPQRNGIIEFTMRSSFPKPSVPTEQQQQQNFVTIRSAQEIADIAAENLLPTAKRMRNNGTNFSPMNFSSAASKPPASGGLFSNASSNPPTGGLFGGPTANSQPQQSGGLFGNLQKPAQPSSGGLFGNTQQASQPTSGGLFGNTQQQQQQQQSQPQQSNSLFGGAQAQNQPQNQAAGGLFGNLGGQQNKPATPSLLYVHLIKGSSVYLL